jgi:hypothetical protein
VVVVAAAVVVVVVEVVVVVVVVTTVHHLQLLCIQRPWQARFRSATYNEMWTKRSQLMYWWSGYNVTSTCSLIELGLRPVWINDIQVFQRPRLSPRRLLNSADAPATVIIKAGVVRRLTPVRVRPMSAFCDQETSRDELIFHQIKPSAFRRSHATLNTQHT